MLYNGLGYCSRIFVFNWNTNSKLTEWTYGREQISIAVRWRERTTQVYSKPFTWPTNQHWFQMWLTGWLTSVLCLTFRATSNKQIEVTLPKKPPSSLQSSRDVKRVLSKYTAVLHVVQHLCCPQVLIQLNVYSQSLLQEAVLMPQVADRGTVPRTGLSATTAVWCAVKKLHTLSLTHYTLKREHMLSVRNTNIICPKYWCVSSASCLQIKHCYCDMFHATASCSDVNVLWTTCFSFKRTTCCIYKR